MPINMEYMQMLMDNDWQILWQGDNLLGEGILWHPQLQTLFWVDIQRSELFALPWQNPEQVSRWLLPFKASHVARCDSNEHVVLASNKGVVKWHIEDARVEALIPFVDLAENIRSNDAAVAEDGSYWIGLMSEPPAEEHGCILRVSPRGNISSIKQGIAIPNTLIWTEHQFIFADSFLHTLFSQNRLPDGSFDKEPEIFHKIDSDYETPDGSAMAADGSIFNAVWQGQRIQRLSTNGEILSVQKLPVYSPTSCAFCGPKLDYLAVTSARMEISEQTLQKFPLTGSLICRKQEISGTESHVFSWPGS